MQNKINSEKPIVFALDDAVFKRLARTYSNNHAFMHRYVLLNAILPAIYVLSNYRKNNLIRSGAPAFARAMSFPRG